VVARYRVDAREGDLEVLVKLSEIELRITPESMIDCSTSGDMVSGEVGSATSPRSLRRRWGSSIRRS
jgi:hypothetical protein